MVQVKLSVTVVFFLAVASAIAPAVALPAKFPVGKLKLKSLTDFFKSKKPNPAVANPSQVTNDHVIDIKPPSTPGSIASDNQPHSSRPGSDSQQLEVARPAKAGVRPAIAPAGPRDPTIEPKPSGNESPTTPNTGSSMYTDPPSPRPAGAAEDPRIIKPDQPQSKSVESLVNKLNNVFRSQGGKR